MESNLSFFSLPFVDCKSEEGGYEEALAQFLSGEEPLEEPDLNGPTTLHCEICQKKFDNAKKYYGHLRVHSKDCLWTCDKCPDLKFATKQQLMKHSLTHKPLQRVWRCPQCSMAFESLWRLQQHLFSKHLEYRPHKCGQCEKSFHKLSDLNKHKSVHDDDRKHGCTQCEMKFKNKSNLKRHMLKHNGEKPYCCPGCGNRFQQIASLSRHKKKCAYAQANCTNIEDNIRKNYCQGCGMSFQYRTDLAEHIAKGHTNPPNVEKDLKPDLQIQVDTSRAEDNIVDDILSAEDDYLTMSTATQNDLLNAYNLQNEAGSNTDNPMQIEFLKDMNQLHSLDDELFYNDLDFEGFQTNQVFNLNTNDVDYCNDRNAEILFDFAEPDRSLEQDIMNDLYQNKADNLPDDLLNVPEVQNILVDKPNELMPNPTVSVNDCSTIFESDVDLEASANLAANLNQLIGDNNVQYISTEDDDTFIISLKSEIDAAQLTDMLNIGMEFAGNNFANVDEPVPDNTSDLENSDYNVNNTDPIVVKITQPKLCIDSGVIVCEGGVIGGKKEKQFKIKVKKNLLFVCRKCNKVFKKKDNFKSHIATHEASLRQHRCRVCGERFSYRSTLNKHCLKAHTPRVLPAHQCSLCERTYTAQWMLKNHVARDHEGLANYVCDRKDCGQKYFKKSDLDRHIRYHDGVRLYSCDICKKEFQQISHKRRHEKSVHCVKRAKR